MIRFIITPTCISYNRRPFAAIINAGLKSETNLVSFFCFRGAVAQSHDIFWVDIKSTDIPHGL